MMSIEDSLAQEAANAETLPTADGAYVRNRRVPKDPSQVYSLRLPVDRLAELRQIADRSAVAPSALMRRWVLEKLDDIAEGRSRIAEMREEHVSDDVVVMSREEYEQHTRDVASVVAESILDEIRKGLPGSVKPME